MDTNRFYPRIAFPLILGILLLSACNQDAIFYVIENGTELKSAAIPGGPTRIIHYNETLYVAGNGIYWYTPYNNRMRWRKIAIQPRGTVIALAATEEYLYALSYTGSTISSTQLYRYKEGEPEWQAIENSLEYNRLTTMYSGGDTLFIGAYQGSSSAKMGVLYIQDTDVSLHLGREFTSKGLLNEATFYEGNYYIAVESQGLIPFSDPALMAAATALNEDAAPNFIALMQIGSSLIAVSHTGVVWRIGKDRRVIDKKECGFIFSGAMAYWEDPTEDPAERKLPLLILGRTVSGGSSTTYYTYGYYEFSIDASGELDLSVNKMEPGDKRPNETIGTTVAVNAKYVASLGTHVVNSLYQAPRSLDADMPIFASTQKDGLWSCRNQVWNVED